MNPYAIPNFIVAIFECSIGLFIIFKKRKWQADFPFFLLILSAFIWQACTGLVLASKTPSFSLIATRIAFFGIILIPITMYHFVVNVLSIKKKTILICGYFLAFFVFLPLSWTPLILDGVHKYPWGFFFKAGPLHPVFMLYFIYFMVLVLFKLYLSSRREQNLLEKNRKKYLFLALFISYIGGVDYLPTYGIHIYPFGYLAVIFCVFILAYAVYRYNILDITIAIVRAGIFVAVYSFVLMVPFTLGILGSNFLPTILGIYWWLIPVLLMAIFATSGPFIYTYLQRKAEARLRREEFQAHQALNKLAQDMMRFTKLGTLLKLIVHQVVKIMKVNSASIYLRDEGNKHYQLRATWGINGVSPEQSEFLEDSSLIKDILLRRVPIVSEELKFGQTSKVSSHLKRLQLELQRAKAAVAVPAFKGDYLFGFLLLGARRDNRLFTRDDLNLLLLLANQSVLAIENAQLFEKEKTLLAEKSRKDALADMAPGVAHQFNNRLAAIITSADAQMALNELKDLAKLSQEQLISLIKDSQNTLNIIEKEALRGKDVANAILKKGKAKLAYIKTDLVPIIQSAIDLLRVSRTITSLEGAPEPEVILDIEKNLPQLTLNESLTQDIFYNLIDNARDAIVIKHRCISENKITPPEAPYKGGITIAASKKGNKIAVTVKDNGIGMDEKTKSRLFVPYFTTKATALKGTGMGLWVIRTFIEDQKGKISVESEYAKGTTFTITFPIQG